MFTQLLAKPNSDTLVMYIFGMIALFIALGSHVFVFIYLCRKFKKKHIVKEQVYLLYYFFDLKIWNNSKIIYYHLISNYIKKFIMAGALVLLSPFKMV